MKTPEEIVKALHLCYNPPSSCDDCPYCDIGDCTACAAKDAEECIRSLVDKVPRWISVEERLPERGITKCSACVKCGDGLKRVVCASYNAELKLWTGWHGEKIGNDITHWMPLPEPPKEE